MQADWLIVSITQFGDTLNAVVVGRFYTSDIDEEGVNNSG